MRITVAMTFILFLLIPLVSSGQYDMRNSNRLVLEDKSLELRFDDSKDQSKDGKLFVYEKKGETLKLIKELKVPPYDYGFTFCMRINTGDRDLVIAKDHRHFIILDVINLKIYGPFTPWADGYGDGPDGTITSIEYTNDGPLLLGTGFGGGCRFFSYDIRDINDVWEIFADQGVYLERFPGKTRLSDELYRRLMVFENFDSKGKYFGIYFNQNFKTIFKDRKLKNETNIRKVSGIICSGPNTSDKCSIDDSVIKIRIEEDNNVVSPDLSDLLGPFGMAGDKFKIDDITQESKWSPNHTPFSTDTIIIGKADLEKSTFTATLTTTSLVVERPGWNQYQGDSYIVFTELLPGGKERYLVVDLARNDFFELDKTGDVKDLLVERLLKEADEAVKRQQYQLEGELLLRAILMDPKNKKVRERFDQVGLHGQNTESK
jgi:hypothetical protein